MAARRLVPLLDRVLVQRLEPPTKSIGGVLLPETSQSKLNEGVVIAVGPGRRDKDGALLPMGVKRDDKVLLPQYGGNEVSINDEDFVLFRDEDILGVLADKTAAVTDWDAADLLATAGYRRMARCSHRSRWWLSLRNAHGMMACVSIRALLCALVAVVNLVGAALIAMRKAGPVRRRKCCE
eukprot:scaffold5593_cov125-Isochrysis_galbana.AAC.1